MRMRRKPWVREELAASKFFVDSPIENIGKWHKAFKRKKQALHLELRMWKGKLYSKTCSTKSRYKLFGNRYKKRSVGISKKKCRKRI